MAGARLDYDDIGGQNPVKNTLRFNRANDTLSVCGRTGERLYNCDRHRGFVPVLKYVVATRFKGNWEYVES